MYRREKFGETAESYSARSRYIDGVYRMLRDLWTGAMDSEDCWRIMAPGWWEMALRAELN